LIYFTQTNGSVSQSRSAWNESIEPNNSVTAEQLESILALNKLCNVAKYLNDGWLPDWKNQKINATNAKYYICFNYFSNILSIDITYQCKESSVYFKSKELAIKAIEKALV
jgi:hypothetical protein